MKILEVMTELLRIVAVITVMSLFAIWMTVLTNIKINSDLHLNNIFDKLSYLELVFSWPGLFFIGIGVFMIVVFIVSSYMSLK